MGSLKKIAKAVISPLATIHKEVGESQLGKKKKKSSAEKNARALEVANAARDAERRRSAYASSIYRYRGGEFDGRRGRSDVKT